MPTRARTYTPRDPLIWRVMESLPASGPLRFIVVVLWMMALVPIMPFLLIRQRVRHRYFYRTLEEQERVISWGDFVRRTSQHSGSIIIEVGAKRGTRFWWSDERVLTTTPVEPPAFDELNIVAYGGAKQPPFLRWCYERYLSPGSGKALLVESLAEAPFETFPRGSDFLSKMRERFEKQEVVVVTFYDTRYA